MPEGAPLPRRFYERAEAREEPGGFALVLDGRPARTPGRAPLFLPTRALGEAVAAEWQAQAATIDPGTMPLTRLANTAVDGVAPTADAVRADIARYAASDLVCYRAGEPDALVAAQAAAWDPVLRWAEEELGARFILSEGVTFVAQPDGSLHRVRERIEAERSPFRLAALHVLTTLAGSVLIALMLGAGRLGVREAWGALHVDELFQEGRWGADHEATERRALREAEFEAAATLWELAAV